MKTMFERVIAEGDETGSLVVRVLDVAEMAIEVVNRLEDGSVEGVCVLYDEVPALIGALNEAHALLFQAQYVAVCRAVADVRYLLATLDVIPEAELVERIVVERYPQYVDAIRSIFAYQEDYYQPFVFQDGGVVWVEERDAPVLAAYPEVQAVLGNGHGQTENAAVLSC